MTEPRLIVLVGPGRVGKDTIGEYLKKHRGFARTSFARPLYDAVMPLYGISPLEILTEDKEAIIPRLGRSLRETIQHLGDHVRSEMGPDILIRRLEERLVARGQWKCCDLVVTDARTDLEIEWARRNDAAVWWVRRDNAPPVRPHTTESIPALHIKHYRQGDFVLDNGGTREELFELVDVALNRLGVEA